MSSSPPPFQPPMQQRKKSLSPIAIIVIIFGVLCIGGIAAIAIIVVPLLREGLPLAGCFQNFEDVRTALVDYSTEHNGKLPKAASWQDDVRPYYQKVVARSKDRGPLKSMPVDGDWGCPNDKTGMAFNSDLSEKVVADIKTPDVTIVIFEMPAVKKNAAEPYKTRGKEGSPKIIGKLRGWIRVPMSGDPIVDIDGSNFDFDKDKK